MKAARTLATIALGSNLGWRRGNLEHALVLLDALPGTRVVARSSWHETEPEGGPVGQPRYLNGVVRVETEFSPRQLLGTLMALEREAGRDRAHELRHGPRTLDLDLVFYGNLRLDEPELVLPHPRAEERLFVLEPLAEFAPDERLPGCGKTVRERIEELHAELRAARSRGAGASQGEAGA